MRTAKSLLLDLFRGRVVPNINLRGLDRVMVFTAQPGRILMRQAVTVFRKSGSAVPRVELREMGPSADLVLRRLREAPLELRKEAHVEAKEPKRRKNVGQDSLVGTVGRVFVPRQEVDEMALTKPKGVKRGRRDSAVEDKKKRKAARDEDGPATFGEFGDGLGGEDGEDGEGGDGEAPTVRRPKARGAPKRSRK